MNSQALKCLIGTTMVKAGQGILLTWGKSNVYYYSYFKLNDPQLSLSYNTLPVAILGIPCALLSLYSIKIAEAVGFERLVRICAFTQFISFLIAPYMSDYYHFILFYLINIAVCYALLGFPLLNCLWSHFSKTEGKVTGIVFGFFGVAQLFFLLLVTYLVNPENEVADRTVKLMDGAQEYKYFSGEIAQNVPFACQVAGLIAGILSACGSLLVNRMQSQKQGIEIQLPNLDPEQQILQQGQEEEKRFEEKESVTDVVGSSAFRGLFFAYFSMTFYEISLGLNFKVYGLSKINDDQYLTWVDTFAIIIASLSNIIWGKLIDSTTFKSLLLKLFIGLCIAGFLVPLSINIDRGFFCITYWVLSSLSKGIIVILGPGLLKVYGEKLGTQLLPMVNISSLFGFIVSPLAQLVLVPIIEFDGLLCIGALVIGFSVLYLASIDFK